MPRPSKYELERMTRQARTLRRQATDAQFSDGARRDFIRRAEVIEAALLRFKFDASKVTD